MAIKQQLTKCLGCPRFISAAIMRKNAGLCSKCVAALLRRWETE